MGRGNLADRDRLPDRSAVDPQQAAAAVIGLNEHADCPAAEVHRDDPRCGPDPALELVTDHAGPAADVALGNRAARGRRERLVDMFGADVLAVDVIEPSVPRLAGHGEGPIRGALEARAGRDVDERIPNRPDRMRVREPDRTVEQPRLTDPLQAGELAVAVERVRSGKDWLRRDVAVVGNDDRYAGPDRPFADDERPIPADDRRVADTDAGDVGDGVPGAGLALADDDSEVARPNAHRVRVVARAGPPARGPVSVADAGRDDVDAGHAAEGFEGFRDRRGPAPAQREVGLVAASGEPLGRDAHDLDLLLLEHVGDLADEVDPVELQAEVDLGDAAAVEPLGQRIDRPEADEDRRAGHA